MIGYEVIEEAVKQRVISVYAITDALCQKGNIDALYEAMQTAGSPFGVLVEYAGGRRLAEPPFNGKSWLWSMNGYLLVRFQGDAQQIEVDARQAIDKLVTLFDASHTLGQITAVARLTDIDIPIPSTINDVPFYWIPFSVEVTEKI